VSHLVKSHFHLKIAERIGETDGIKALDRNGKALKKQKCLSWVVSVSRDSMAQCRNEVRTDLVNRTERLKGYGKEMMIAYNFNILWIWPLLQLLRLYKRMTYSGKGGHCVSNNCDVPGSAATITPWNES